MSQKTDTTVSEEIRDVIEYRRAARRIVRDEAATLQQACAALIRLAMRARQEAEAADLAQAAIWAETDVFVTSGERPMDREAIIEALARTDPADATLRGLLRDGYVRCPSCARSLPDERALDRQQRLARASLSEALLREEAV